MISRIASDAAPEARLDRYRVATIVSLGLMESGGLIVITLALLAGTATWILAGGGTAAVLMFLARPTQEDLQA